MTKDRLMDLLAAYSYQRDHSVTSRAIISCSEKWAETILKEVNAEKPAPMDIPAKANQIMMYFWNCLQSGPPVGREAIEKILKGETK